MNNPNDSQLLLAFLNDELPTDQHDELFARLRSEPELVRQLLVLAADEELLREWATGHARPLDESLDSERVFVTFASEESAVCLVERAAASSRRNARFKRYLVPVITTLLLMVVGFAWWLSLPTAVARVEHVSSTVGLSQSFGWRTLRVGESLKFDAGVVELTTSRGVRIVAEGPFDCRFDSVQKLTLLTGRLYADVPEAGRGFQVQTPDGEIVDWGTKFGIEVRKNQVTEVHVFEGKVTAELASDDERSKSELQAGQAVKLSVKEHTLHEIPLSHKFAQQAAPYAEHFSYREGPLAGNDGWFDRGLASGVIHMQRGNLDYPGLTSGDQGRIEIRSHQGEMASPVGRRWHDKYVSMIISPDDDFPKQLTLEPATLISFGSLSGPDRSDARLVVRKSDPYDRQGANFGLAIEGASRFAEKAEFRGFKPSLIVLRLSKSHVDLWINPSSDKLGQRDAPAPGLRMQRNSPRPPEALWLNDANNPRFTWYYIDAIRGGDTWADVTPRK